MTIEQQIERLRARRKLAIKMDRDLRFIQHQSDRVKDLVEEELTELEVEVIDWVLRELLEVTP